MSHVIPPHVFQVLKSHRWNCNVLGRRRKFGHPNYVRVLGCEARGSNSCVRSSAQHTLHDARDASTRMHICGPTHRIMGQRAQTAPTRQHDHMHQLKYRLSRTRKPKSHPSSNTQCPITPAPNAVRSPSLAGGRALRRVKGQNVCPESRIFTD